MQHNQDQRGEVKLSRESGLEVLNRRSSTLFVALDILNILEQQANDPMNDAARIASLGNGVVHFPEYLGPNMISEGSVQPPANPERTGQIEPPHYN